MKTKKLIGLIAICVLGAISLGSFFGLARATINDIAGFDFKTVNEANYINVDSYKIQNNSFSSFYTISDDGEITIDVEYGDVSPNEEWSIVLQTVTLEPGEYVFNSGVKNTSRSTYGMKLVEIGSTGEPISDADIIYSDTTFKVTEQTNYNVVIFIAAGASCEDVTFAPVLVEKSEKTKFYVYDFNIFDNED